MSSFKSYYKDVIILGFALFSMFFGAGNVIFPPYLGLGAASSWIPSFIAYFIADIGLAVIAIFAILKVGGDVHTLTGKLGRKSGILLTSIIILCIGPLVALPRTGATTYEMCIVPFFGNNIIFSIITSLVYYSLVFLIAFRPSSVVDILGKFFTPAFFVILMMLISKGIISPLGPVAANPLIENVIAEGITAGYQTLDTLAALAFGVIIIKSVEGKGYASAKDRRRITSYACILCAISIFLVFSGMAYLGATTSTFYNMDISRAQLLTSIIQQLFGNWGSILLCLIVFLACLTTAAALTSTTAEYFSELSKGKFSYKNLLIFVCIFSAVITNIGLDPIIAFATPILNIVYPAAIVLIILAFLSNHIRNVYVYRIPTIAAMIISLMEIISNKSGMFGFVKELPFAHYGFSWIVPTLIIGILSALAFSKSKSKPNA